MCRHDFELTGTRVESEVAVVETCARCGEQRERGTTRWSFAAAVIDRAKKLDLRGARGRQAQLAFEECR